MAESTSTIEAPVDDQAAVALDAGEVRAEGDGDLVEEDLLVEEVSIDGMCGVY
jgi:mycofactocin precursor